MILLASLDYKLNPPSSRVFAKLLLKLLSCSEKTAYVIRKHQSLIEADIDRQLEWVLLLEPSSITYNRPRWRVLL